MDQPEIVEDGLRLRPWRAGDAGDVHRACQDPDIQRWTRVPTPYLPERAASFVTGIAPQGWAAGTAAHFAVCDVASGALLGSCGLVSIDRGLRSAEVGYWTAPWARGRGVAVHATRALSRWAFAALDLRRLVWQAELGNHASRLVALRTGFRVEGRLRLAGTSPGGGPDAWVGSLLPTDLDPAPGHDADHGPGHGIDPDPGVAPGAGGAGPDGVGVARVGTAGAGAGRPGSIEARRAAVFGRPQPILPAVAGDTALRLRPLAERDTDAVVAAGRDPETVRWTSVPDPYQRPHARSFIHEYAPQRWAGGDGAVFAIATPDDEYAGIIELRLAAGNPHLADLGFAVAPAARGRGYCPAGLRAVCRWGFTALGLTRIEWRANVGNTASRRAAEKAGFVMEGTARQAIDQRGVPVDAWVGALLPADLAPASPTGLTGLTGPAHPASPTGPTRATADGPGGPGPEGGPAA